MYNWDYIEEHISEIIVKHTTISDPELVMAKTNSIVDAWLDGKSFEKIIANDKPPNEDADKLMEASAHLDLAIKSLMKIGRVGNRALLSKSNDDISQKRTRGYTQTEASYSEILAKSLLPLSNHIKSASSLIKHDDLGLVAILSNTKKNPPRKKGRKQNFTALNVTRACAVIFEAGTGLKAKITRNTYVDSSTAGGAFHAFLSEVFKFLEIKASAEHFIKELRSEEMRK